MPLVPGKSKVVPSGQSWQQATTRGCSTGLGRHHLVFIGCPFMCHDVLGWYKIHIQRCYSDKLPKDVENLKVLKELTRKNPASFGYGYLSWISFFFAVAWVLPAPATQSPRNTLPPSFQHSARLPATVSMVLIFKAELVSTWSATILNSLILQQISCLQQRPT